MTIDIIIPIYKPQKEFIKLIHRLQAQTYQPNRIIIMNTEEEIYQQFNEKFNFEKRFAGVEVYHVEQSKFDHGHTRHEAVLKSTSDVFIMMTQDAIPASKDMIKHLVDELTTEHIAVAYARQIATAKNGEIEVLSRQYNYPKVSMVKTKDMIEYIGIKAYFSSNVCAAYKRSVYNELGGFSFPTIFNEDLLYATKTIQANYKIAYVAAAKVIHAHDYTCWQQFQRNFDNGVSQKQYGNLLKHTTSESEGMKYVKYVIQALSNQQRYLLIPYFFIQTGYKFIGFQLGKRYEILPSNIILKCTSNQSYWKNSFTFLS